MSGDGLFPCATVSTKDVGRRRVRECIVDSIRLNQIGVHVGWIPKDLDSHKKNESKNNQLRGHCRSSEYFSDCSEVTK